MKVFMLVSQDKYELPMMVCDTAKELAEKCGVTINCVCSSVCHAKTEKGRRRYVKVEIDENEED